VSRTGRADVAARIVRELVKDLDDRRGLGQEWRAIDPDIKKDLLDAWRAIVRKELET
jgi:hypothetical protein